MLKRGFGARVQHLQAIATNNEGKRTRKMTGKRTFARDTPHPLAGRWGDGPPFAPENWKWIAGRRLMDMYFLSPMGTRIRSRTQLQEYLASMPDPPRTSEFQWRVNADIFKDGPLPGDVYESRRQRKQDDAEPVKKKAKGKKPQQSLENTHLPQQEQGNLALPSTSILQERYRKARSRRNRSETVNGAPRHSFRMDLANSTSYKWLYCGTADHQHFMKEAERLKTKTTAEITGLRQILFSRNLEVNNLARYNKDVLRVFVYILRNEEPPAMLGKLELASLCVEWRCKHRNSWCFLEVGHMHSIVRAVSMPATLAHAQSSQDFGLINESSRQEGAVHKSGHEGLNKIVPTEPKGDFSPVVKSAVGAKECTICFSTGELVEMQPDTHCCHNEADKQDSRQTEAGEIAMPKSDDHVQEDVIDSFTDNTGSIQSGRNILQQGGAQEAVELSNTSFVQPSANKQAVAGVDGTRIVESTEPSFEPAATVCLCKICVSDGQFCRGCTCIYCKEIIRSSDRTEVLECTMCSHVYHFLCAHNAQQAGAFDQSELDGEFMCGGCARKNSLWPFLKRTLESAARSVQMEEIQEKLSLAVMALKDTHRAIYQGLHYIVMDAYKLAQQQPTLGPDLFQLLRKIQEELDVLRVRQDGDSGQGFKMPSAFLDSGQDLNWFEEERKVHQLQKLMESEFKAWTQAERVAKINRTVIAEHVRLSEAKAREHMERATNLSQQAEDARHRCNVAKQVQASVVVTLEQVEAQQEVLERATLALEQVHHEVSEFQFIATEKSFTTFSGLLEKLANQRFLVEEGSVKLDRIGELYHSSR